MDFRPLHAASALASWSAIAQTSLYDAGLLPLNPPQSWLSNDNSVDEWDRSRFNVSGTRGRLVLASGLPGESRPVTSGTFVNQVLMNYVNYLLF